MLTLLQGCLGDNIRKASTRSTQQIIAITTPILQKGNMAEILLSFHYTTLGIKTEKSGLNRHQNKGTVRNLIK